MRAVILAGGLGLGCAPTRRSFRSRSCRSGTGRSCSTSSKTSSAAGVKDIDLCVNYLGGLIETYFAHADLAARAACSMRVALGAASHSAPPAPSPSCPDLDETFIAMNGDVLTTLDYRELVDFHRAVRRRPHDRDARRRRQHRPRRDRADGSCVTGLSGEADAALRRQHGHLRLRAVGAASTCRKVRASSRIWCCGCSLAARRSPPSAAATAGTTSARRSSTSGP